MLTHLEVAITWNCLDSKTRIKNRTFRVKGSPAARSLWGDEMRVQRPNHQEAQNDSRLQTTLHTRQFTEEVRSVEIDRNRCRSERQTRSRRRETQRRSDGVFRHRRGKENGWLERETTRIRRRPVTGEAKTWNGGGDARRGVEERSKTFLLGIGIEHHERGELPGLKPRLPTQTSRMNQPIGPVGWQKLSESNQIK